MSSIPGPFLELEWATKTKSQFTEGQEVIARLTIPTDALKTHGISQQTLLDPKKTWVLGRFNEAGREGVSPNTGEQPNTVQKPSYLLVSDPYRGYMLRRNKEGEVILMVGPASRSEPLPLSVLTAGLRSKPTQKSIKHFIPHISQHNTATWESAEANARGAAIEIANNLLAGIQATADRPGIHVQSDTLSMTIWTDPNSQALDCEHIGKRIFDHLESIVAASEMANDVDAQRAPTDDRAPGLKCWLRWNHRLQLISKSFATHLTRRNSSM